MQEIEELLKRPTCYMKMLCTCATRSLRLIAVGASAMKWIRVLVNECSALLYGLSSEPMNSVLSVFLMTTSGRKPQGDLETVIDQPLKRSKRPDHPNANRQAVPQALESNVAVDPRHGFPSALTSYPKTRQQINNLSHPQISQNEINKTYVAYQHSTC